MKQLLIAIPLLLLASMTFAQEDTYIEVLRSDAPLKEKTDACRELWRVGTEKAVPTLAQLLGDETLSHWARYALEPIDDPSVDAALRNALGTVEGPLLAGVIDSLGVRQDAEAVEAISKCLTDTDPAVAQAAAHALGRISGPSAIQSLNRALSHGSQANRFALCEGLFRCAETASDAIAIAIYDQIHTLPELSHASRVAALRGAILRRGPQGIPLLIKTIRTDAHGLSRDALGISTEIPGKEMTVALTGELAEANPQTQQLLLKALGHRGDVAAAPTLISLTRTGPTALRVDAIRSLVQLGTPSSIPVLAALTKDAEAAVSNAAQAGLIGFPGDEADAIVVALLNTSNAEQRMAAIEMARQRRVPAAIGPLLSATADTNTNVVTASLKALGELAGTAEIPDVVNVLLKTPSLGAAETALSTICSRQEDKALCSDGLLAGLAEAQGKPKLALLRVLRTVGDAKALAAMRTAAADSDKAVSETAARALCDWPTADALPDLARLAESSQTTIRILAIRGQLRLISGQGLTQTEKLAHLKTLLPLITRTEEYRLALAALGKLVSAESLNMIVQIMAKEQLAEEAALAAVAIAEGIVDTHPTEVAEAMKKIRTKDDKLAARVAKLLPAVPEIVVEEGFTAIFNGRDLTGWDGKPGWWTVEDGALTAESTTEKPCKKCNYLIWRGDQPDDFELRTDFRLSLAGNSGIQIRSEERPDWDTYGYQADMTGDGELIGFVYHHKYALIAGRGTKATFAADGKSSVEQIGDQADLLERFKPGDWNTYRVVCLGPEITLYINDKLMCQITDHRVSAEARRGIIALQMHPGPPMKIEFKNIRLRELK